MKNVFSIQLYVIYGYVGNSVVVFLMQCFGINVWLFNIVQLLNYMQYGYWVGSVIDVVKMEQFVDGVVVIGVFKCCDVVLFGFFGLLLQVCVVVEIVCLVKVMNLNVWYFCDLVMGQMGGIWFEFGVEEFIVQEMFVFVDGMLLNYIELQKFVGWCIEIVVEVVDVCCVLICCGLQIIFVKYLYDCNSLVDCFNMFVVIEIEVWIGQWLLYVFLCYLVGVGDLISVIFVVCWLCGDLVCVVFEYMFVVVYVVVKVIYDVCCYEFEFVVVQDEIVCLSEWFGVWVIDV